ncbi:MAG: oxygen-independent coproporphyrinogen III oxidase [Verrucomicrobiae bacterium]|nr:oxygen-independent coproporphyrinogen III oxidase [Verrucomicrobiae bacterium]
MIDFSLVAKYDRTGPRYTSYPTAPHFTEAFTAESFREEIRRTNAAKDAPPLSLYFHLPFCESVCFFCGCNVTFTSDRKRPEAYTESLVREMDAVAALVDRGRRVEQLHWGGGTPTFFRPEQMRALHEATRARFAFAPDAEVGLEVDPRETTEAHLQTLAALGFNRLSLGVQDFDPRVQKAVNRIQHEDLTRCTIAQARDEGFTSVSVDLIYGLPHQTEASFVTTIEKVLALDPDRVAVFNFAYLPEMIRHQKAIPKAALPSPGEKLAILRRASEALAAAGYRYVGMDHFAKPEDDLCRAQDDGRLTRNFQGYSTHGGCDLFAFGVSAISQVGRVYAQNHKNVHLYEARARADGFATQRGILLTPEDEIRREAILRLMCDFRLDTAAFGEKHGISFPAHFADALEALVPMERDGLLAFHGNLLEITPTGRYLIRNICMAFDARLAEKPGHPFSRTV